MDYSYFFEKKNVNETTHKLEIKMGEKEENWQPAKFYCSEIKLIYSNT